MKLAFFDNYKLGVVVGDKIVDVSAVTKGIKALGPQDVIRGVIEKWSSYKGKLAAAAKKGKGKPLAKVKLRPPLPKPERWRAWRAPWEPAWGAPGASGSVPARCRPSPARTPAARPSHSRSAPWPTPC